MLHITNGDSPVAVLRAAGMAGEVVPWRDVLHEGPVREGLGLEALSRERAAFIAEAGWGSSTISTISCSSSRFWMPSKCRASRWSAETSTWG